MVMFDSLLSGPLSQFNPPVSRNRLLLSLSPALLSRLQPDLTNLQMEASRVLMVAGDVMDFVYFPTTCMISMVVTLENGSSIEASTIGSDGFAAASALLGVERTDATHIIQLPGDALVMPIKSFREHLADAAFREPVSSYVAKTLSIVAQSSACIAFHPVQERLARWLLMVQDCTERDKFALTQDFIAVMLGVYRPTVTLAMHALENAGLIHSTQASSRSRTGWAWRRPRASALLYAAGIVPIRL